MNYFETRSTFPTLSIPRQEPMSSPQLPSATDVTRFLIEGLVQPVVQGFASAAVNFSDSMAALASSTTRLGTPQPRPHTRRHRDCCCEAEDPCHCHCCIVDADLVIHARLGEVRVVPLSIENRWRRERQIHLELSQWTRKGGAAGPVTAELLPPAPAFTLPPCGQQTIVMIVRAAGQQGEAGGAALTDVDQCTVYYADLRVTGCDIRPVRIAVALLPRDCHTYRIECSCGCC